MSKLTHALGELKANYDDEFWWRSRIIQRVVAPLQQAMYGKDGVRVVEEDWDNLLILDSCRADYFEDVFEMDAFDDYRRVQSLGSATPEWVTENFLGGEFGDIVYVHGNPWVSRTAPNAFHDVIDVWATDFDEERKTVMADVLSERAKEAAETYPDKRIVVHYNQPHGPYIADVPLEYDPAKASDDGDALEKGVVTEENFRAAYESNLEYIEPYAMDVAESLPGKSVVSADHGELFGKRLFPIPIKAYAHPLGLRDPELTTVPWAVVEGEERKDIIDEGVNETVIDDDVAKDRLRDLGYRT